MPADVSRETAREVKGRTRRMAGLPERGRDNYDPVGYVTDSFSRSFRAHGVAMSQLLAELPDQELAGRKDAELEAEHGEEEEQEREARQAAAKQAQRAGRPPTGGMESNYLQTGAQAEQGIFFHKFADVSFNKGTLAAGVMQGTGRMMLVSAMKEAYGKSLPTNRRQRTVFGDSSLEKKIPQEEATAIYNRDQVQSAVAMVTSSISAGSAMLRELAKAAKLAGDGKELEAQALYRAYPFLSTEREREALQEYRARLREADSPQDRAVLEYGAHKTQGLLQKKQSMRKRFELVLEELGAYAQRAELEFADASLTDEVFEALTEYTPDDLGGDDGAGAEAGAGGADVAAPVQADGG